MRAGRLVELLGLLQARGRMTAAQLAGELEVSQRTVLRDIEALSAAGFPVYAVRGSRGGFELLAGSSVDLPGASPQSARSPQPADSPRRRVDWPTGASQRARVRLSPRGRRLAALTGRPEGLRVRRQGRRPAAGRPGWVEAWLPVSTPSSAAAEILALGTEAEVIEPAELRDLIRQTALLVADLHRPI